MNALAKGTILGGLTVFVWGMISWTVLPWHYNTFHPFKSEQGVQLGLLKNVDSPEPKIYVAPYPGQDMAEDAKTGPHAFVALRPKGMDSMPKMMFRGLLTQILLAHLITLLLLKVDGLAYWDRVKYVTIIGAITAVAGYVPDWNWWGFSTEYAIVGIIDQIVSWFLGGLVIAKVTSQ